MTKTAFAIMASDIRAGTKKKLPLLLYVMPAGWMVFYIVIVYLAYTAKEGKAALGGDKLPGDQYKNRRNEWCAKGVLALAQKEH